MMNMNRTWIMFLNEYENLPKGFVKNVKYLIQEEDYRSYKVMGEIFYKPLQNVIIDEVKAPRFKEN